MEDGAELDGFKDFTVSSSWERLIASVECVCQDWQSAGRSKLLVENAEVAKGLRNMYVVSSELSQGYRSYKLELFFSSSEHGANESSELGDWQFGVHHLQLWFGVKDFLVISPMTISGVLLDAPEATMLLSTVAIALSNSGSSWPVFVPVHVPTRKAFMGNASLKSGSIKFEADRLGSQVPIRLMHLEGLYDLFVSKLGSTSDDAPRLRFTMRLTYETAYNLFHNHVGEQVDSEVAENVYWDDEFPWAEWQSLEDPIKGFHLIAVWRSRHVSSPIEMAEYENASTFEADRWMLQLLRKRHERDETSGFAGRLRRLVQAFVLSKEADFMEDFVTVTKSSIEDLTRYCKVPPSTVLDRMLKDIFFQAPQASPYNDDNLRVVKGAPPDSLFGRFCLHALWLGDCNIRAIATLWIDFLREIQWCWEELQTLPRCSVDEVPDYSTCLTHQKLQLLATCIDLGKSSQKATGATESDGPSSSKKSKLDNEQMDVDTDEARRGSAGPFGDLVLCKSNKLLHAPITQKLPIMTEDMLQEREQALATLENSPSGKAARIRLQSDILASDMSAFKAANPSATLEDFVRWHSPRDWIQDDPEAVGRLSKRMAEPGNAWVELWETAEAVPALEQKRIFDHKREGEKVLHYLETVKPFELLAQVLCTAFVACADVLWKTPGCKLKPVLSLFDRFFSVMAAVLAPLRSLRLSVSKYQSEWERDLLQLCNLLERLEIAVAEAASLSQKLPQASSSLLSSLCSDDDVELSLEARAPAVLASYKEREMIADTLFSHQSVSETWEETLRMGNFLNGHEPVTREVIFTCFNKDSSGFYGETETASRRELFHRMYACGSPDDLQLAVSSSSYD